MEQNETLDIQNQEIQNCVDNLKKLQQENLVRLENIRNTITKLKAEEQLTIRNMDTFEGAIQAYTNAIHLSQKKN